MKTHSPNATQIFSPEVSHTLQALSFIQKSLGIKEPSDHPPTKTEVADPVVRPKFKVVVGPINFGNPWQDTGTDNDSDFVQFYVTRDFKDIEAVAEVTRCDGSCREEDHQLCVQIGNCFDLRGNLLELSSKEQNKAREEWIRIQELRAPLNAEYSEY